MFRLNFILEKKDFFILKYIVITLIKFILHKGFKEEKKRGLGWMLHGGDVLQAHKKLLNNTIIRVMCVVDQTQQFRYTLAHQVVQSTLFVILNTTIRILEKIVIIVSEYYFASFCKVNVII